MAADERISRLAVEEARPVLRVYGWKSRAISLGRRQTEQDLPESLKSQRLPFVWRPTGGGAVCHTTDEFTYAFSARKEDLSPGFPLREIACLLHRRLLEIAVEKGWLPAGAVTIFGADPAGPAPVCFVAPARGDLMHGQTKVAGAALRVWRDRVLVQGSIQGIPLEREQLLEAFTQAAETGFEALSRCREF